MTPAHCCSAGDNVCLSIAAGVYIAELCLQLSIVWISVLLQRLPGNHQRQLVRAGRIIIRMDLWVVFTEALCGGLHRWWISKAVDSTDEGLNLPFRIGLGGEIRGEGCFR